MGVGSPVEALGYWQVGVVRLPAVIHAVGKTACLKAECYLWREVAGR
jgi:hypothetical protein